MDWLEYIYFIFTYLPFVEIVLCKNLIIVYKVSGKVPAMPDDWIELLLSLPSMVLKDVYII